MPRYQPANLKAARLGARLTQRQEADALGVYISTVVRYENGQIIPTARVLGDIARVCGVDVSDLYDPDDAFDPVTAFQAELAAMIDRAPPFTEQQKASLRVLLRDAV